TRFRPSSISSTLGLRFDGQAIQQRLSTLSFQPLHSAMESRFDLAIRAACDVAHLNCAAKFTECLPDYSLSLFWITRLVFVVNRQLLIRLIPVPRISHGISPKLTCQNEDTFPLGHPCHRPPRCPICLGGQNGCNRLFVEAAGSGVFPSL